MKKIAQVLLIVALFAAVALSRGNRLDKQGKEWLAGYNEPATVNVSGTWQAKEWGQITLVQAQGSRDVTGRGDGWDITGVVSGNTAYLLFSVLLFSIGLAGALTRRSAIIVLIAWEIVWAFWRP